MPTSSHWFSYHLSIIDSFSHLLFSTDLPPNARLDDLASLLLLDSKNIDPVKLGSDLIKEQQRINLKFSSNQSAVIPDDRAQIMLAGVSERFHLAFERVSF